jgi:hypothetical protein
VDGRNNFPKLHNAMWPGLVGKGPNSEPPIGLDEMLELTAAAEVDSIKFDGVDLFLAEPHTSIDSSSDDIEKLADKIAAKNLEVGSVVAPVWPPVGGSSAMGDSPGIGCATPAASRPHLLGRLHVPQQRNEAAANLERCA